MTLWSNHAEHRGGAEQGADASHVAWLEPGRSPDSCFFLRKHPIGGQPADMRRTGNRHPKLAVFLPHSKAAPMPGLQRNLGPDRPVRCRSVCAARHHGPRFITHRATPYSGPGCPLIHIRLQMTHSPAPRYVGVGDINMERRSGYVDMRSIIGNSPSAFNSGSGPVAEWTRLALKTFSIYNISNFGD